MDHGRRSSHFLRRHGIVLGIVLAFTALFVAFDWNWLRGPLIRHLQEKSGREVRIDDLKVTFDWRLTPTVRVRGLYIENADWATRQPMAVAREAAFTIALQSLWSQLTVVTRLALVDADISMERKADGLRNWRLTNPEDRGPGLIRVISLAAENSKLHFINEGADFEVLAHATPLGAAERKTGETFSTQLEVEGRFQGFKFAGSALVGDFVSFRDSGEWFPLRGHFTSGKTRLEIDGRLANIFDLGPVDAQMRLTGGSLSQVHPFLRMRPPYTRPYVLEAKVRQANDKYEFTDLKGKIGGADISGEATYDRKPERPVTSATLHSKSANLLDIVFLAGMDYRNLLRQSGGGRSDGRMFSTRVLNTEPMKKFDAHMKLTVDDFRVEDYPVESLHLNADLVDGAVKVSELDVGAAGGHIVGGVELNARANPLAASVNLEAHDLRLERLISQKSTEAPNAGGIRSRLRLNGSGKSFAAIAASARGTIVALIDDGSISNLADAKLALNFGKVLGLKIKGDEPIALYCGAAAFDFKRGIGRSQALMLETEQTHTDGAGVIDLRNQTFELLLTPHPKKRGILTLDSSIRVKGPLKNAKVSIDDRVPLRNKGATVPPATLAALFRPLLGNDRKTPCAQLLAPVHTATSD